MPSMTVLPVGGETDAPCKGSSAAAAPPGHVLHVAVEVCTENDALQIGKAGVLVENTGS